MKLSITYDELYAIERDIQRLTTESPALSIFLRAQFQSFLKNTAIRRNVLHEKLKEIRKRHILFNADDNPITLKDETTGNIEWQFLPGEVDMQGIMISHETAHTSEVSAFLNISFDINY